MSTLPSPNHLRAEYLKIRTLRLPALALVAGILFSGAIGVGGVLMQKAGATVDVTQAGRAVTAPMWFLVAVVAILASAGEFQHHTIRTTLLTTPRRADVLLSRAVVTGGYGAAMTALGMAASLGAVLAGALFAMLASALGMLTRGTALAISALLLWYFVGEAVLPVVLRQPGISNWTPTGVATTLIDPGSQELTTVLASGAGLLGCAAIFSAARLEVSPARPRLSRRAGCQPALWRHRSPPGRPQGPPRLGARRQWRGRRSPSSRCSGKPKNPGVESVFLLACDGRKGLPDTMKAVFATPCEDLHHPSDSQHVPVRLEEVLGQIATDLEPISGPVSSGRLDGVQTS